MHTYRAHKFHGHCHHLNGCMGMPLIILCIFKSDYISALLNPIGYVFSAQIPCVSFGHVRDDVGQLNILTPIRKA